MSAEWTQFSIRNYTRTLLSNKRKQFWSAEITNILYKKKLQITSSIFIQMVKFAKITSFNMYGCFPYLFCFIAQRWMQNILYLMSISSLFTCMAQINFLNLKIKVHLCEYNSNVRAEISAESRFHSAIPKDGQIWSKSALRSDRFSSFTLQAPLNIYILWYWIDLN